MSKLISGKEALIALASGEEVEFQEPVKDKWIWMSVKNLTIENILNHTATYTVQNSPDCMESESYSIQFRLKPKTITINGIEVPAPFKAEDGYRVWVISDYRNGYHEVEYNSKVYNALGAWRSEEEIKQVVEALKSAFKPQ